MATGDLREQQDRMRTTTPTRTASSTMVTASTGGGLVEACCGLAVIALSIAGLATVYGHILSGIAQIVFGAGLLAADARVSICVYRLWRGSRLSTAQSAGGLGAEAVGGLAGIVLGILTLVDLVPLVLSSVAIIVFGASVILGGVARARLAVRSVSRAGWPDEDTDVFQEANTAAIGGRALTGLAAIVLGILGVVFAATVPLASMVLALVGLLCLGAGSLLTGSAFGGQVLAASNR